MPNFENHPLHPGEGSPLFIAAGVIKHTSDLEQFLSITDPLAAPMLTLGSFIDIDWPGNATISQPDDFVYYSDHRMAGNARGLPGNGLRDFIDFKPVVRELMARGFKINVSVTNLPHETPADVIPELVDKANEILEPTSVEINLSCPNGLDADGNLHPPTCNNPDASEEVMVKSRQRVGESIYLGAKDSAHITSPEGPMDLRTIQRLSQSISPYINFVTGINTIGGQPFPEIKCAGGKGGMSGPIVAPVARLHLAAWQMYAPDLAYLSCGGVDSQNIAVELPARLAEGALLVGGAQQFYRNKERLASLAARWLVNANN